MTRKKNHVDKEWTRRQVEAYRRHMNDYKLFGEVLERILRQVAARLAPMAIVQTRHKTIASFAEKCQRKKAKYSDAINQFTDLCGGRVIVHTADEVRAVSGFIQEHFEIDQENTIDVSQRLKPTEFGYRSVHYIIRFKPGIFPNKEVSVEVPPILLDDKRFPNRRAEVQVRTILEHAWADMAHDLAYKSSFKIPVRWEREFAGVAAMLESADKTFSRIKEGLRTYATSYGAYMTEEQMREEIKLLDVILEYDAGSSELAGRVGKLAITLGDWQKAIDVLSLHVDSGCRFVIRDLGVALCKKHKARPGSREFQYGRRCLEKACETKAEDSDSVASLAGTWKDIDNDKARGLYGRAFQLDPSNPYPLENYLDLSVAATGDASIVFLLTPAIELAVKSCQAQADVGVNLPWAYYMMGKFFLFLGRPYDSLEAYAKAIQLSAATWLIDTALASLENLKIAADELSGYQWVWRLLLLGKAARLKDTPRKDLAVRKKISELSLREKKPIEGPVVIVAGGCDSAVEGQMKAYKNLILEAFADFKGTLISGGTTDGISGLVGELGEACRGAIRTIGYLPKTVSDGPSVDYRYSEICKTAGSAYSPLEPLQYWIDIHADGIDFAQVKVLGINGGIISAMEYRIALALGAEVGIVGESGREAAKLVQDEKWAGSAKLLLLPADAMTLKAFVGRGEVRLEKDIRERLAKEIHKSYCLTRKETMIEDDPSMLNWEDLPDVLKESNVRQADHISEKLRKIGYMVQKPSKQEGEPITFTDDEIEVLAEIEHGRWVVERLLDGWTHGEEKDIVGKKSPFLVSWLNLPEEMKELDRASVRKIPECLAEAGLEICRQDS